MNIGSDQNVPLGERRMRAWHRWGHYFAVIPGMPVAYILGAQSAGNLSFAILLGWIVLVEGVALGVTRMRDWKP